MSNLSGGGEISKEARERLINWILDGEHHGHHSYCKAVKGPDNENWYEDDECDCGRNEVLSSVKEPEAKKGISGKWIGELRSEAPTTQGQPHAETGNAWRTIETLDKELSHFVMIYDDGVIRVQLWNHLTGKWEHPNPIGEELEEGELGSNPSHWMPLPPEPSEEGCNCPIPDGEFHHLKTFNCPRCGKAISLAQRAPQIPNANHNVVGSSVSIEKWTIDVADEIQARLNDGELTPHILKEILSANYPVSAPLTDSGSGVAGQENEVCDLALVSALRAKAPTTMGQSTVQGLEAALNALNLDPHTRSLVARFALAMAEKLAKAQEKYGYADGWRYVGDHWPEPEAQDELIRHIQKGDPRDVANFCAFLWHHGKPTRLTNAGPQ